MPDVNFEGLNRPQLQAVTAAPGPVLVLAGPGSGKTRVLTYRIAYLIKQLAVRPYKILAVTFTNKAAREMESRIENLLGERPQGIWLGTFHSVCVRILRREADFLPVDRNFVIFDDDDQKTLIRRALDDLNLDEKTFRPGTVQSAISNAKNNLETPADLENKPKFEKKTKLDFVLPRIYRRYQELLETNNAVDFDDLLLRTLRLLESNEEVLNRYAKMFEHILVDEFQDTNEVQYRLVRLLASVHQNIFVVGDEDQSIYRWRGADYRNVLRFEEDFPKAEKILLEQNYRSTQNVLDVATAVINKNLYRTPKRLKAQPDRGEGEKITIYVADDDNDEADYVVRTIQNMRRFGVNISDFAIMYRTNAQSRVMEEAFLHAGIPYRLVGAQRFYGRREVKDVIAYLRLIQNPADEISLLRIINVPSRKIGDRAIADLQLAAGRFEVSAGSVLLDLGEKREQSQYWEIIPKASVVKLADFGMLLAGWHAALETLPLPELFDRILEDTGYPEYLQDGTEEGRSRWENVQELRRIAYEFGERGLVAFLENLALVSDQDTVPQEADAPTLLTLHAAKGLEFPIVFIIGLDEGLLPHSRSIEDPANIEELSEERRLFYVGLTRAKKQIFLVRTEQRKTFASQKAMRADGSGGYGMYQRSYPSRFLEDIPEEYIKPGGSYRRRRSDSEGYSQHGAYNWRDYDSTSNYQGSGSRSGSGRSSSGRTGSSRSSSRGASGGRSTSYSWRSDDSDYGEYRETPRVEPKPAYAPIIQPRFQAGMRVKHPTYGEGIVQKSVIEQGDETVYVKFYTKEKELPLVASLAKLEILGDNPV